MNDPLDGTRRRAGAATLGPQLPEEAYSTEGLASRCGVTVRTIHRWRKHPDFPAAVVEGSRESGGGHAWSLAPVRAWLDARGQWDWAMDRAFSADRSGRTTTAPPPPSDAV